MFDGSNALLNVQARYTDLLQEAANERRARSARPNRPGWLKRALLNIASLATALGLLPR